MQLQKPLILTSQKWPQVGAFCMFNHKRNKTKEFILDKRQFIKNIFLILLKVLRENAYFHFNAIEYSMEKYFSIKRC